MTKAILIDGSGGTVVVGTFQKSCSHDFWSIIDEQVFTSYESAKLFAKSIQVNEIEDCVRYCK